jgi:hypothetical protein
VETASSRPAAGNGASGPAERLLAQVADRTVIPVARVFYAFGGGGGGGGGGSGPAEAATRESGSGSGGGGAGVRIVPVAVIEVTPDRTRVRPIVDVATLATRAFVFAAFVTALGLILGRRPDRRA